MSSPATSAASKFQTRRAGLLPALLLTLAGLAAYANSFGVGFVFDGTVFIVVNPAVRTLEFPHGAMRGANRPVAFYTFALNYWADGFRPWGYHAVNLAIHVAAALTLFGIVRRTLAGKRLSQRYRGSATVLAFAIALCWELHPLETQSVTYIYQRLESLMGLCLLFTLYAFIRSVDSPHPRWWRCVSVAACAVGMGVKEVTVVAPLLVLWYDRVFVADSWRAIAARQVYYACLFSTWAITLGLMLGHSEVYAPELLGTAAMPSPLRYALTQCGVICHYLRLCFWPTDLCIDYGWPVADTWQQIVPPLFAMLALLGLWVWCIFRRPTWGFVGAAFFLVLAPTSSFLHVTDLAFEHRMYVSLAAVVTTVVIGVDAAMRRWVPMTWSPGTHRRVAAGLISSVAVILGVLTWARNEDYRDPLVFWQRTVAVAPRNPRAWLSLSDELLRSGDAREGLEAASTAIELRENYGEAYVNRGNALLLLRADPQQAKADFERAIEIDPHRAATAYIGRGKVYLAESEFERARVDFERAVEIAPADARTYANRGYFWKQRQQFRQSIADCTRAIQLNPDVAWPFVVRSDSRQALGDLQGGVEDCSRAITLDPKLPDAYVSRALAFGRLQNFARSAEDCRRFVALKPDSGRGYYLLGLAELNLGRHAEAVENFDRAIQLEPGMADAYLNRAFSYLELGEATKSRADIEACRQLGGQPNQAFLKRLESTLELTVHETATPHAQP